MAIQKNTTCVIKDGFGGSTRTGLGAVDCRIVEQIDEGRPALVNMPAWTHYLEVEKEIDIRDGQTRVATENKLTYADGDEVRVPNDSGTKFVVVLVVMLGFGTPQVCKRAYLLRDAPVFAGGYYTP